MSGCNNPNSNLTTERIREVKIMWNECHNCKKVAKQLGIYYDTVKRIIRGEKYKNEATDIPITDKYPVAEWVRLRNEEGWTYTKIADEYGFGAGTVRNNIKGEAKSKLPQETKNAIIVKYVDGATMKELADKYDVGIGTIGKICREAGVARSSSSHHRKFLDDQVREIRRRAANGESYNALASEFDCTYGTISNIVNRRRYKNVI
jgi:transposase